MGYCFINKKSLTLLAKDSFRTFKLFSGAYMDVTENVHDKNEMSATDPKNVRKESDDEEFSVIVKDNEKEKIKRIRENRNFVGSVTVLKC